MIRWLALAASTAVGVLVALAALGVVHQAFMPWHGAAAGLLAAGFVAAARRGWDHLPGFVASWLDLGVVVVVALLAVVGQALSLGVAYAVLRGPELTALFGGALLLGGAVSGLAYTHLRLAAEVAGQQRRMAELERAALESRLAALSAQINPHFLFNTLNTLAEVVHEDEDAAEDLVTDLSAMMRYALRSSTQRVPLSEEIAVIRRLLRIEKARLGDRLDWSIEGDAGSGISVPGLLIQPLVENAVKYAAAGRAEGGRVTLSLEPTETGMRVVIADDGPGLPADVAEELADGTVSMRGTELSGGGLRNCLERLRLTWPQGGATLTHDAEVEGCRLVLELPREDA